MPNPRDTGGNVKVDFVWGNIPMQPDDDRGEDTLDPELDNHIIATDGWASFPEFEPNVGFDIQTVIVPNVVDFDSVSAATSYLLSEGLTIGAVTTSTVGATTGNWGWVKSQNPAANASVAPGTAVDLVSYEYVSAATTGSISGFNRNGGAVGWSLNGTEVIMYLTGRSTWPAIGSTIDISGTSNSSYNQDAVVLDVKPDDSYNTGGVAVKLELGNYTGETSSGGTWTKQAGFGTADATLTGVGMSTISGPGTDWAFAKGVHSVAVGDWVRASGFYVIDESGNRTPSGSININGDWQIDAVYGSYFTSAALRAEIGALSMQWASSFDTGTLLVDYQ